MKAIILLASLGIISMLSEIFRFKNILWYIIIIGLAGVFAVNLTEWNLPASEQWFPSMLVVDNYAVAFTALITILILLWFLIAYDQYHNIDHVSVSDHFSLILFSSVGALILASYTHLSMLFLGIEILSIPLYILAGSNKKDLSSNEAALKYFMMGAFATGVLLFGITLVYGATGKFNIIEIGNFVTANGGQVNSIFYIGLLLILIALCFKVSAAPFHFWTPDVYQGAPVLVTAYMSTIVKTAAFAAFFRLFATAFDEVGADWTTTLSVITAATILIGNVLASYQTSVKRILAYSGIAQAGYLLLSILVLSEGTKTALWLYTASYSLATLGAFGVVYYVIKSTGSDKLEAFNSLGKKHPVLAFVMTISMLSLAAIPPTLGFFSKFYLFSNVLASGNQYLWLVIVAIIGSLISVYYYFKLIIEMYAKDGLGIEMPISPVYKAVLLVVTLLIIVLGLVPGFLIGVEGLKIEIASLF